MHSYLDHVFLVSLIYDTPSWKQSGRCHVITHIVKPFLILMQYLHNKRVTLQPACYWRSPTCCGRDMWGGGGGWHLLNIAISGFDHSVVMAHSGHLAGGCWVVINKLSLYL